MSLSWRLAAFALLVTVMPACGPSEDPARAQLRNRLRDEARLTEAELHDVMSEVGRAMTGRTFRVRDGAGTRDLTPDQRDVVFSMLSDPAGVYDEGLRRTDKATYRVLNGPGRSDNAEIEALQRLWIDPDTFLPMRYQFAYAFPGYGDYEYELTVQP